jgi:hypothetical protein
MALEFTFAVTPDEHGIYDGRELARQFIGSAYRLLVPYVNACPACSDNLFNVIADRVIEELHQRGRDKGGMEGFFYSALKGEERDRGGQAHFAAATETTIEMLREAGATHEHGDDDTPLDGA